MSFDRMLKMKKILLIMAFVSLISGIMYPVWKRYISDNRLLTVKVNTMLKLRKILNRSFYD